MTAIFIINNGFNYYRFRIDNVATVMDEPYPPGGMLRVMRDKDGRILAGPLVSELTSWQTLEGLTNEC